MSDPITKSLPDQYVPQSCTESVAVVASRMRARISAPVVSPTGNHFENGDVPCQTASDSPEGRAPAPHPSYKPRRYSPEDLHYWPVMARKAIALRLTTSYRLWITLSNINRLQGGDGWIELSPAFLAACAENSGVSLKTIQRAIERGETGPVRFWERCARRGGVWLRLVRQEKIGVALSRAAFDAGIHDPFEADKYKCAIQWSLLTASIQAFEAAMFAGWVSIRRGQEYRITIRVLETAWRRSRPIFYEWFRIAGVSIANNWGHDDTGSDSVPQADYYRYGARREVFQRGNTYTAPDRRIARGKSRAIRASINQQRLTCGDLTVDVAQQVNQELSDTSRGGLAATYGEVKALLYRLWAYRPRLNWDNPKACQTALRKHPDETMYVRCRGFVRVGNTITRAGILWQTAVSAG